MMKFIKLLCIVIFGIVMENAECTRTEQSDEGMAVELEEAIESKNFQVITLTRPSNMFNMRFLLPHEIVYLFQQLSKCFGAELPPELDSSFLGKFASIVEQIETAKDDIDSVDIYNGFKSILPERDKYLRGIKPVESGNFPEINLDKWTILVFQECFFSKMHALNNFMVDAIVKYCKALTKGKKLIVVVNFLHEFEDGDRLHWLSDYQQSPSCFSEQRIFLDERTPLLLPYYHQLSSVTYKGEDIVYTPLFVSGAQRPKDFKLRGKNRLANYSLVIANGKPVAIYRKTFYVEEKNPLIDCGHVYEFGDMKVHKIPRVLPSPFFGVLFGTQKNTCKIFICGDLNIGWHPAKDRIFTKNVSRLSIIESNSIPLSSSQTLIDASLRTVFSENGLIIHADSRFGPFVGFLKENNIFAYIPYNTRLKVESGGFIPCSEYPLMVTFNRIHTGMWGCSFENRCCIINYWNLQGEDSIVKGWFRPKRKKSITLYNFKS